MTEDDLRQYTSRVRPPITGELKTLGLTMYSPEPPSSGVVMQYIMRLLDGKEYIFRHCKRSLYVFLLYKYGVVPHKGRSSISVLYGKD